jgi:hypothetical protein
MKYRLVIIPFHICAVMLFSSIVFGQINKDTALQDTLISYPDEGVNAFNGDTVLQINSFTVNDDSLAVYKKDKEFAYMNYLDSLLKRSKDLSIDTLSSDNLKGQKKINRSTGNAFPANNSSAGDIFKNPLIKIILTTIAVFFIVFILYRLFFSEGFFRRNGFVQKEDEGNPGEMISDPNAFNSLINEAVAKKDYRLATRYMYLQTLQMLFSRNLLEFAPDKTNDNYTGELINTPYQHEFASLTMNYEYVWYGKFEIDYELFKRLQNNFKQFRHSI